MARPVVSPAAEVLYDALDPAFTTGDEGRDWAALNLCAALVSGDIDAIESYVMGTDDALPAWAPIFDPATAPVEALPYLAQFAGARLRADMSEAQIRDAISDPEVFRRGSPAHIVAVAKRRLTGTKTVLLQERYTGSAYRIRIATIAGETPDSAATQAEIIREAKPIGVRLFFNANPAWTWAELVAEDATWTAETGAYPTWGAVETHTP